MEIVFDPSDINVLREPHAIFDRLRAEDPVHWSPTLSGWVFTRYDDVGKVLADGEFSSDRLTPFFRRAQSSGQSNLSEIMRYISLWMVFRDPPEHTRLRRLLNKAVNPSIVAGMTPQIGEIVGLLLDRIEPDVDFDFMADFAIPLPALVIMDMMGVPRDKLPEVKAWSDDLINFVGSPRSVTNKYELARAGLVAMVDHFRQLVAERRVEPRNDILSYLIATQDEQGMMTDDEVVASAILLLFAGHETTTNLLGNAMMALDAHPDSVELMREPANMTTAIEEFLRYDGPLTSVTRAVAVEHEIAGKRLRVGDRVFAMLIAANRDPDVFDRPHGLDLLRNPNRHLMFGRGIHFCLGAPLAKLEARIAFTEIFARYGALELSRKPKDLDWLDAMVMRGVRAMPARFTRHSAPAAARPTRIVA